MARIERVAALALVALALATPALPANADEPAPAPAAIPAATPAVASAVEPSVVPSEAMPAEATPPAADRLPVELPVSRPPWSGREAIWGGVGLIIAGTITAIAIGPPLCTSSLFGGGGGTSSQDNGRTSCFEATLGGGGGGVVLGAILLIVGETQRATYKEWLRAHPMFGGLSASPTPSGPTLGWTVPF